MAEATARRTLGELADELQRSVERAVRERSDTQFALGLNGIRDDVEALGAAIGAKHAVLDAPEFARSADADAMVRRRREWAGARMRTLRDALAEDPGGVRRGDVWREAKRAFEAYARTLDEAVETAWTELAARFEQGDEQLLSRLPSGSAGLDDYRRAVRAFREHAARQPTTAEDVRRLARVGERMASLRERLEREAIPSELQEQWRLLHDGGLSLDAISDEFRAWLDDRALTRQIVLRFRPA